MIDEERYQKIRTQLQTSPNSKQGFEILRHMAKAVGNEETEKAAASLTKEPTRSEAENPRS